MNGPGVKIFGLASNIVEESVGGSGQSNPITKFAPVQQVRPILVSILGWMRPWDGWRNEKK
jgi:hypothetical protein